MGLKFSGRARHGRRGIGTVLATVVFVFIVIFMTANLIVWGIVQSANLQAVINKLTQRDQQQAAEKISLPSALFGGSNKYSVCAYGTASNCPNPRLASSSGTATTPLVSNENFTTSTQSWTFTKILAPGTSSGITGGFDAGGTEVGAVGSPSGPGMVYMGVSFFPPTGTATYSATWSNKFLVDLSQFGLSGTQGLTSPQHCTGPNCQVVGSWAWILPRVNPGVIALTAKFEIADSSASGTSCSPPHCYIIDQQTYTTLADQTWNYRKVTWGSFSTSGTATGTQTGTTLQDTNQAWTANQWANYTVTITAGTGQGESALICSNTAAPSDTLTITYGGLSTCKSGQQVPWTSDPTPGTGAVPVSGNSQYVIELSSTGTSSTTCSAPCATITDSNQKWYPNEWVGYYVSINGGTGTGQTLIVNSNTYDMLTLNTAWTTAPDTTSQYIIGCPPNTFCDFDEATNTLLNEVPTTYTPAFWGIASSPGYYTVQVEADFTLSQSTNPAEVRVVFDDVGLEFKTPSNFAAQGGSASAGTILDRPLTNGENPGLIQQLTVSTATAFSIANVEETSYIKNYATGSFDLLSSGLVSRQTVNATTTFTGAEISNYIGTLTARNLLNQPTSSAFDSAGNLWVVDQHNNRILEYDSTLLGSSGPNARIVIGQSSFTTSASATSASGLNNPESIAFDYAGDLWVADKGNNRILMFEPPFSTGMSASLVVGQSTFASSSSATTQIGFTNPSDIAFDPTGNLWVADTGNNRVLKYLAASGNTATGTTGTTVTASGTPGWPSGQWVGYQAIIVSGGPSAPSVTATGTITSNTATTFTVGSWTGTAPGAGVTYAILPPSGQGAQLVFGQQSFTVSSPIADAGTATGTQSSTTLQDTSKVWSTNQWVNGIVSITSGTGVGQSRRVTSNNANTLTVSPGWYTTPDSTSLYSISPSTTTQTNLNGPTRVKFDSPSSTSPGNLWIDDGGNNRIVEYLFGSGSGTAASTTVTLSTSPWTTGQWSGYQARIISGTGAGDTGVISANAPNSFTVSSWSGTPAPSGAVGFVISPLSGASMSLEIGQPAGSTQFTTSASATSVSGLSGPYGLTFDSTGNLWVADTGNNRVLEYLKGSGFINGQSAYLEIGQPLVNGQPCFTCNTIATTSNGMNSPTGVVFDGSGNLWVTDKINYRVLYLPTTLSSGETSTVVIGQSSFTVAAHPNVEFKITATSPSAFMATTMAASVQDFYKDPNHVTVQVSNGWASTSHVADIFVIDASGTHCFTRTPASCAPSLLNAAGSTAPTSTGSVSSLTLTDTSDAQGAWTSTTQFAGDFLYILLGTGAGAYGTITGNSLTTGSPATSTVTVSSWVGGTPSGTSLQYFIGQSWAGAYVAPGTTAVISLPYTWATGPVTIKVTTDLGNVVVLNTIAS